MTSTSSKLRDLVDDEDDSAQHGIEAHEDVSLSELLRRSLAASEQFLSSPTPSSSISSTASTSASTSAFSSSAAPPPSSTLTAATPSLERLLSSLSLCSSLVSHLGLLSSNEVLSEISTRTLPCLLIPYYRGMLDLQSRTRDYNGRKQVLKRSRIQLENFKESCDDYGVISREKRMELKILSGGGGGAGASSSSSNNAMSRRDAKIKQYKEEKALKDKLEIFEQRRSDRIRMVRTTANTSAQRTQDDDNYDDEDDDDDDIAKDSGGTSLRSLYLTRISLCYLRTHNELSSIDQELELLENMPHNMSELPPHHRSSSNAGRQDSRQRGGGSRNNEGEDEEDTTWRLDKVSQSLTAPSGGAHTLLDTAGRVLRPFTILPSITGGAGSSLTSGGPLDTRLRLQSQVFQPGHRLPTMGIDEFLDLEKQRGNILQGGGPKNTQEVEDEKDENRAKEQEDDTESGELLRELKRQKDKEWDEYKDTHRKGDGNRMNRG